MTFQLIILILKNRKSVALEPTFPPEKSVQEADHFEHLLRPVPAARVARTGQSPPSALGSCSDPIRRHGRRRFFQRGDFFLSSIPGIGHFHKICSKCKFQAKNGVSSARSECSTSLSFSPTPTRRSMQRRVTLSQPPSRSDSCSPLRGGVPSAMNGKLDEVNGRTTRCSPATSISSGLGRSFSPASAHSYQRPMGILSRIDPSFSI